MDADRSRKRYLSCVFKVRDERAVVRTYLRKTLRAPLPRRFTGIGELLKVMDVNFIWCVLFLYLNLKLTSYSDEDMYSAVQASPFQSRGAQNGNRE